MNEETVDELVIDEAELSHLDRIPDGVHALTLKNSHDVDLNDTGLFAWLSHLHGIEAITSITLSPSSHLEDLAIIKVFPGLTDIQINGLRFRSLAGINAFHKGRYLNIDTGKNRNREIADIADAPIIKLSLQYARPSDFDAIGSSLTLRHLELGGSPRPPLEYWTHVPLSVLSLSKGGFKRISNIRDVNSLRKMSLIDCSKLEMIEGDDSHMNWLAIQGCGRLHLRSIASFPKLESVLVVGRRNPLTLSELGPMLHLTSLSLENCEVDVDLDRLEMAMPKLTHMYISNLAHARAIQLSRANPGIMISNSHGHFNNGVQQ